MSLERIRRLNSRWRTQLADVSPDGSSVEPHLGDADGLALLETLLLVRHLDLAAHELRAEGHGHYTICSTGHEANALVGRLTRPDDPALLHYRSAAFQLERARQVDDVDSVSDIAHSLVAARDEPTSGGRHKVFGHPRLGIIPSTSTIASHIPRALGLAFALERRPRLGLERTGHPDSIAVCSFGDASLNHSTALGALNAASWTVHQKLELPLLVVVEDNGLGISVRSPSGWVETRLRALPHFQYFDADGSDLDQAFTPVRAAVQYVRERRRPAVLQLRCTRLLGHAGSDVDTAYRSPRELADSETRDPALTLAHHLIRRGALSVEDGLELDTQAQTRVQGEAERARRAPRLTSRQEIEKAILPTPRKERPPASPPTLDSEPVTLARGINQALSEALSRFPETLLFGQDVAKKGGVYGLTKGLLAQAGPARVFNTLLDEQTILGLALGTATLGLLPIPEIQYLAYLHNAEDQLRGEAATMSFFSGGAESNPMVIRIPSFAYQKGFGGHFHNDNSVAVLRDIPGLVIAVPARGDDATALYRRALTLARDQGRVVVMLEPIALYHTRDLTSDGDQAWLAAPGDAAAELGRARIYHPHSRHLTIISYGNGLRMSLRVAQQLKSEGIEAQVVDLRWLAPLPIDDVVEHATQTGRVLVVDECRETGSVSETLATCLIERCPGVRFARVTGADCFIPLGEAANLVLVSEAQILTAARRLAAL